MYVLVFQRKPCLRLSRFTCLKYVQHFDAQNSNQKKKKGKSKKKNI